MSATATSRRAPRRIHPYLAGALCICAGALAYNLMNVIVKVVSGSYPLTEFLVIRALATLPIMGALVLWEAGPAGFRVHRPAIVLLRSVIFFGGSIAFGLAVAVLAVADAVSIYFIMPLAIAGLAGPILGERVPLYRWAAISAGLVGVLVIMRPGAGVLEWAALIALAGAILESLGQITSRMMPANRSSAVGFYQSLTGLIGALLVALLLSGSAAAEAAHPSLAFLTRAWVWPEPADLAVMIVSGPITAVAIWLYVHGYKVAPASFLASFEYTGLVWAILFGFLFFGDVPAITTAVGASIVIASGLYMLRRDRRAGLL